MSTHTSQTVTTPVVVFNGCRGMDHAKELEEACARLVTRRPSVLVDEVVYAVTHEGARHLDDVLVRRTRISIETFDRGVTAAPHVARLMGEQLGWSAERLDAEVDHYLRRVEAERESQKMLTDQEADEARIRLPDLL